MRAMKKLATWACEGFWLTVAFAVLAPLLLLVAVMNVMRGRPWDEIRSW